MRDNTLLLQILTIAHVYGHNDFFKNNFTFASTRAELTIEMFKAHAMRVRRYVEDPSIGVEKVERMLDAAHALSAGNAGAIWRSASSATTSSSNALVEAAQSQDRSVSEHPRAREVHEPDIHKVPVEPDEDLLLFIRDHNPFLAEWEKDLLTIVDEEAKYFIPMMETKIMNEGWASYWHKRILESLDLDQGLHLEFIVRHNQVVRPIPGQINPYHLGLQDLGGHLPPLHQSDPRGNQARRPADQERRRKDLRGARDRARQLVPAPLPDRRADARDGHVQVRGARRRSGGQQGLRRRRLAEVKETLIKNVGANSIPVIKVEDADFGQNRTLYLKHDHDGRDLQLEYAEKTPRLPAAAVGTRGRARDHAPGQALAALLQRARLLDARAEVAEPLHSRCGTPRWPPPAKNSKPVCA